MGKKNKDILIFLYLFKKVWVQALDLNLKSNKIKYSKLYMYIFKLEKNIKKSFKTATDIRFLVVSRKVRILYFYVWYITAKLA